MKDTTKTQKQINDGYIEVVSVEGQPERYVTRSLREVLEWKLSTKKLTKKGVLSYLAERSQKAVGSKEKAKLATLTKYFNAKTE